LLSKSFTDYAQDHADLGAALNGFSLNESEELSGAIEKTGQAVDVTYMSTMKLVRVISIYPRDLIEAFL
jgi:sorting nexin-4